MKILHRTFRSNSLKAASSVLISVNISAPQRSTERMSDLQSQSQFHRTREVYATPLPIESIGATMLARVIPRLTSFLLVTSGSLTTLKIQLLDVIWNLSSRKSLHVVIYCQTYIPFNSNKSSSNISLNTAYDVNVVSLRKQLDPFVENSISLLQNTFRYEFKEIPCDHFV